LITKETFILQQAKQYEIKAYQKENTMKDGWEYHEYVSFLNHLFLQEFIDFDYKSSGSTAAALETIE